MVGPASIAVAAGPDEVVALAALGLDQAGIDRRGKARIVQLDGEIFALRLAGGLLPGCAKIGIGLNRSAVGSDGGGLKKEAAQSARQRH